ncbi:hypothetical protein MPRG_30100 [Mycobacterium paragordonae]|uniref:Uncharacterized protein n=1 Tax=Mycobacterium paragordonae TaxID=1389713 RepID=A0ABQ1C658_9MYCO|nr:hypothetical protein MPRG_30100 [Mycobacterium paragordonae]
MGGHVVGVEFSGVHGIGAGGEQQGFLMLESVGIARRQHHGRSWRQASREFNSDLAATAENYQRTNAGVVHGCDYGLR